MFVFMHVFLGAFDFPRVLFGLWSFCDCLCLVHLLLVRFGVCVFSICGILCISVFVFVCVFAFVRVRY